MKEKILGHADYSTTVAPLAGAWIESMMMRSKTSKKYVAPLAGAWIERNRLQFIARIVQSRPPRGGVD